MRNSGFTVLEVLMVVAILALLGAAGVASYRSYVKNAEVRTASSLIQIALKNARSRAMTGYDERKWGIRFINAGADYYELFSTPSTYADASTTVESTEYLPTGVTFTDPVESGTKDIIFTRASGTTTASSVGLATQTEAVIVSVSAIGSIISTP